MTRPKFSKLVKSAAVVGGVLGAGLMVSLPTLAQSGSTSSDEAPETTEVELSPEGLEILCERFPLNSRCEGGASTARDSVTTPTTRPTAPPTVTDEPVEETDGMGTPSYPPDSEVAPGTGREPESAPITPTPDDETVAPKQVGVPIDPVEPNTSDATDDSTADDVQTTTPGTTATDDDIRIPRTTTTDEDIRIPDLTIGDDAIDREPATTPGGASATTDDAIDDTTIDGVDTPSTLDEADPTTDTSSTTDAESDTTQTSTTVESGTIAPVAPKQDSDSVAPSGAVTPKPGETSATEEGTTPADESTTPGATAPDAPEPAASISETELQQFAEVVPAIQAIERSTQQEVAQAIDESGLSRERFGQIYRQQTSGTEIQPEATSEEEQSFNEAYSNIQKIQQDAQAERSQAISAQGMDPARFDQILAAVLQDPALQQQVQSMMAQ
jgi:hypothetical protein